MGAALAFTGIISPVQVHEAPVVTSNVSVNVQEIKPLKNKVLSVAKTAKGLPTDNKSITWDYLTHHGFSRIQAAGIMGNLQQEHGFQTSDVPGGLGIAQWIGGRRDNLLAKPDPYNITTQLDFMMEELNGSYINTLKALRAANTVEEATRIFQNGYEGCGVCIEDQRISYAYGVLNEY